LTDLLTTAQVAALLGMKPAALRNLIARRGVRPAVKVHPRLSLWARSQVESLRPLATGRPRSLPLA